MSVYTRVEPDQMQQLVAAYDIGELVEYSGITEGMVNSNFRVCSSGGDYVLTLFEFLTADELNYFLQLIEFLSQRRVACPAPLADRSGHQVQSLNGRPAVLFPCLAGDWLREPDEAACAAVGAMLGRMHRVGQGFPMYRYNDTALEWWRNAAQSVLPFLDPGQEALLRQELGWQQQQVSIALPEGVIHGDLFRDNVLFDGGRLSGFIDFYSACQDRLIYDLAICVNDWCLGDNGLDAGRAAALLGGYHQERRLSEPERRAWPGMLRAAALRFWLSRLVEKHFPRDGEMALYKDPDHFRWILQMHVKAGDALSDLWL